MQRCPFDEAARYVQIQLRAAACSIYEHVSVLNPSAHGPGDKLVLLGTSWIGDHRPQPPDFDTREATNLVETQPHPTWKGFTSFVARRGCVVSVPSRDASFNGNLEDGRVVTVVQAGLWYEIDEPGPLLAAPIRLSDKVAGVVRVVRRPGNPFDTAACRQLEDNAELIKLLLLEARAARELIARIHQLDSFGSDRSEIAADSAGETSTPKRDSLLEGIAAAAKELLRASDHDVAIYMQDPSAAGYTLRAPIAILALAEQSGKYKYSKHDEGVTAQVWRDYDEVTTSRLGGPPPRHLLSHDLEKDLDREHDPPGRFAHITHIPGDAETQGGSTKSFIAVPILSRGEPKQVEGVIRATSSEPSAFSYSDVVTLKALAEATARLLQQRRAAHDKERPLEALMKTIEHGVVVVDRDGLVKNMNPAALTLLNVKSVPTKHPIADVLFYGRAPIAKALETAVMQGMSKTDSATPALSDYVTVVFRASLAGPVPIPVRVRASKLATEDDTHVGTILTLEPLRSYSEVVTIAGQNDTLKPGWRTADPKVAREFDRCQGIGKDSSVLILGETGVGKNLLASRVHEMSARRDHPFVAENCAEYRPELAAAELFGTREGAFSGAVDRRGRLEEAPKGTVFLDEIAELPLAVQATLLKLIDEKQFKAVGDTKPTPLDVRFVAATNADFDDLLKRGTFRADLYHRLSGRLLRLPPLRNRVDLLLLADDYLQETWTTEFCPGGRWTGQVPAGFDGEVIECFLAHPWPGNVRDLRSVVRTSVEAFLASPSTTGLIRMRHLPVDFVEKAPLPEAQSTTSTTRRASLSTGTTLARRVAELEDTVKELRDLIGKPATASPPVDLTSVQALLMFVREDARRMEAFLSTGPERTTAETECRRYIEQYRGMKGTAFAKNAYVYAIRKVRELLEKEAAGASSSARASNPAMVKSTTRRRGRRSP